MSGFDPDTVPTYSIATKTKTEASAMIQDITAKLYSDIPVDTLYHYTTFSGLLGIVESGNLWASDIRYMNDSAELKHTADLISAEVDRRIADSHPKPGLLHQFRDWIAHRITNGHMLFGASFRSNGNLLSQWRGYSSMGKGVSVGFPAAHILECASQQSFQVGKCIYSHQDQTTLIRQVMDVVEALAEQHGEHAGPTHFPPSQSYHGVFEMIESDLLRIAAILKHPSFQEEEEWRIVSPGVTDYLNSPVKFREGASMLVPYFEFNLTTRSNDNHYLEHIYLGPTPNINLSMNSLNMFLTKHRLSPKHGITYCQIPYRQR
ncbi:DUF2971 domain-containing protein [Hahella sp. CR1]|uniref:DUF2971 domain-containing protein n=1 Tax=Hahella sp. CR1 TaxID=2992807 RepID=UPI00244186AF|nr:DUF2971 domain-containing protein [Hahella sp. CR1]MDG9668166.1 DUF2971 domain-containing protein [Hahella sp. CR1]